MTLYNDGRWFVMRARQLATLMAAGLSLPQAIDVMETDDLNSRDLWQVCRSELVNGAAPLVALRHVVPAPLRSLFGHVDIVPDLSLFLNQVADWVEQRLDRLRLLGRQLVYPLVLMAGLVGVSVLMVTHVVPQYLSLLPQGQAPPGGIQLIQVILGAWQNPYVKTGAGMLIGALVLGGYRLSTGWVMYFLGPRFRLCDGIGLLSTYLQCGVPLNKALDLVSEYQIPGQSWQPFCRSVLNTGNLADGASVFLQLSAYHTEMIRVAQRSNQFATVLSQVSNDLRHAENDQLERRFSLIQPALFLLIGGLILCAAYMTLAPVSSILGS